MEVKALDVGRRVAAAATFFTFPLSFFACNSTHEVMGMGISPLHSNWRGVKGSKENCIKYPLFSCFCSSIRL